MGQQKARAKKVHYGGHFGMNTSAIKPPFHARTKYRLKSKSDTIEKMIPANHNLHSLCNIQR